MWFQGLTLRAQLSIIATGSLSLYLCFIISTTLWLPLSDAQNAVGKIGWSTAHFILTAFGLSSFMLPLFLAWWSYRALRSPSPRPLWLRLCLKLILLVGGTIYLNLFFPKARIHQYSVSGLVGADWGSWTQEQFGSVGGFFVVSLVLFLCALCSGKVSINELILRVQLAGDFFLDLLKRVRDFSNQKSAPLTTALRFHQDTGPYLSYRSRQGTTILQPLWTQNQQPTVTTEPAQSTTQEKPLQPSNAPTNSKLNELQLPTAGTGAIAAAVLPEPETPAAPTKKSETKQNDLTRVHTKKFALPSASLLSSTNKKPRQPLTAKDKKASSDKLIQCLLGFDIHGDIIDIIEGPRVITFEFQPGQGTKLSKIQSISEDLALALGETTIRIVAPIPGRSTVGFEIPQKTEEIITMKQLVHSQLPELKKKNLPVLLGRDLYGEPSIADLTEMPHLLVAGSTGSGKSIFVNTLLTTLLMTKSPQELRLALVDPKMIEFGAYNGIPHLLGNVIVNPDEAKELLQTTSVEMDRRYKQFSALGSRDIVSFNQTIRRSSKRIEEKRRGQKFDWNWEPLPYLVIVVDEMADLMMTQGKEVEIPLTRLAQKARASGIHLVLATQRPSSEVITGLIKTNFPSRIAFKVTSGLDSRTILDTSGAEKLLGKGDMLFMSPGQDLKRVHSAYISDEEVQHITSFWGKQNK